MSRPYEYIRDFKTGALLVRLLSCLKREFGVPPGEGAWFCVTAELAV